jgi:hypothetical protein
MVKIRYAGSGVALSSRALIEQAIQTTSAKFDNNIISNRFEQVTTTTYEVTIKCVSSRGKGAKKGTTGRRTQSCCWHAWGTFFDELFRLNPEIVIVAQGNRITRESGNWVDRPLGSGLGWEFESNMCDCEENGWVRDSEAHSVAEHADSCGVYMPDETTPPTIHRCDSSCRHNSANNNGALCHGRNCVTVDVPGWEPLIDRAMEAGREAVSAAQEPLVTTPIVARECSTCRYSYRNTASGDSECPPGKCLSHEGQQNWQPIVVTTTTQPTPRRHCVTCRHSITNTHQGFCPLTSSCTERAGFQLWEEHVEPVVTPSNDPTPNDERHCCDCRFGNTYSTPGSCNRDGSCLVGDEHRFYERWVEPTATVERECKTCKYSMVNNNGVVCFTVIGECLTSHLKWEPYVGEPKIVKECDNCKYSMRNGCPKCYHVVGTCSRYSKWEYYLDVTELNVERYLPQSQVMPEEKTYMGFFGGE